MTYLDPHRALAAFAERLATQTDAADVHAALQSGDPGFVLLDVRSAVAWRQAHIPGAVHLPHARIPDDRTLDPAVPVVTYCWGPGCNGATRAAWQLARRGLRVKEMLGGIEYWIREGLPVRTPDGDVSAPPDPRVAPSPARLQASRGLAAPGQVSSVEADPAAGPGADAGRAAAAFGEAAGGPGCGC